MAFFNSMGLSPYAGVEPAFLEPRVDLWRSQESCFETDAAPLPREHVRAYALGKRNDLR